jgi:hypothetical protein
MKNMRRCLAALFLACILLSAQDASPADVFSKAPPEVDEALRSRVAAFFQAQADGKFRQAEAYVAEDSKDIYYNGEKRKIISFDILKINYSEDYTKADVIIAVEIDYRTPRMTMRVKPATASQWKLENGQWVWYVVPRKDWETPFGIMQAGPDGDGGGGPGISGRMQPEEILSLVKLNRSNVELRGDRPGSETLEITNGMPGEIRVAIDNRTPSPGLKVDLEKDVVPGRSVAKVEIAYQPPKHGAVAEASFLITVQPTNQHFPVKVVFTAPPPPHTAVTRP